MFLQYHIPTIRIIILFNKQRVVIPLLEVIHIVGCAIAIGSIFMQDLRM
jgi:hypothetical protein